MNNRKMNERVKTIICMGICLTLLGLTGCAKEATATMNTTVTVDTQAVETGTLELNGTYIGAVSDAETVVVVPQVSGKVENVFVSVGDKVTTGELLCRFDDRSARFNVSNAQSSYSSALAGYNSATAKYSQSGEESTTVNQDINKTKANTLLEDQLRLAEDNYNDMKTLFDIGAASQSEVDNAFNNLISVQANIKSAKAGIESAQASIQAAKNSIDSAQYQLSLYTLTAPISGTVEVVNVTKNNSFVAGNDAIIISNPQTKTVTFYVTDTVLSVLQNGQGVTVTNGNKKYTGSISEIGVAVDAATGLFKVKATIEGASDLPNGIDVELQTISYAAKNSILVPCDAVYFDNGDAYVFVAKAGKAVKTEISISLYDKDNIVVESGLQKGQEIITGWSASLKDGAVIKIAEAGENIYDDSQAE
ncbi:efflux RND transporter periplasmic adaptor subunit [Anaerotignum propionicum]|uniref:efflux RND transporter periplasmic adaptor subunit n=1 Tax=Anaerotignum propionicum TaxID=28446 RepID=UPI00289C9CFC|nr:efflux RND transporter periplasmic adaptor subunit [Anaerotignum propionicum]